MVEKPGGRKIHEVKGWKKAIRLLCFPAWAILALFVLSAFANLAFPWFTPAFAPSPIHSLHLYYPSTSGLYLGNPTNFRELNLNITLTPGPPISEGLSVNLSVYGIVSPNLARNLTGVVVGFFEARGPQGNQRIIQGSSGWGVTLRPGPLQGYQLPFIVAGSMWLGENSTTLTWPSGTGGQDYYPIVEAQYRNGSHFDPTTSDFIHVYSSQELSSMWQGNVGTGIAIAGPVWAGLVGLYKLAGRKPSP